MPKARGSQNLHACVSVNTISDTKRTWGHPMKTPPSGNLVRRSCRMKPWFSGCPQNEVFNAGQSLSVIKSLGSWNDGWEYTNVIYTWRSKIMATTKNYFVVNWISLLVESVLCIVVTRRIQESSLAISSPTTSSASFDNLPCKYILSCIEVTNVR